MEDDEIEQQDDFPLRWSEWAMMMPLLLGLGAMVFVVSALGYADRRWGPEPEGDDMDNRQGY